MSNRMYYMLVVSNVFMCCEMLQTESMYGERYDLYPKTSCLTINHIETTARCFLRCINAMDGYQMFSYCKDYKVCMCCADLSGSDVTGFNWQTYIPRRCGNGYVAYNYTDHQICLKFVNNIASYIEASAQCQIEGGNLFKMDTKLKHDILTEYLVAVANGVAIDVWIQSEKVGNEWKFHDGSPMPMDTDDVCPRSLHDVPYENRIRVRGSTSFRCMDQKEVMQYYFLCEYYRQSVIS
uniref:Uncharacterized protein LOC111116695 n=1 Tax=Crassostrea virginica TaxID=6565 RepID=A0A8B8C703_CRAVI|nr:uncharacterized protein LOC111116695 [Crassostrea virginica]